ncbi:MAG: agmatinase [Planctomycetaceae bacterium]|jgi:agmatinase|nr:agmatinase [Planctomycetaceae bacterium]
MKQTFLNLEPIYTHPETAKFFVLPVPYEGTVCFLHGTLRGPEAILAVSNQMEHFDEELFIEFPRAGIVTLEPLPTGQTPEEEMELVYQGTRSLFQPGKFPLILGGEHSITPPIVKAATESYPDLSVLQFDAHADLRDSYQGSRFSHACTMRRVLESTQNIVQVGIRSFSLEEYEECTDHIDRMITVSTLESESGFRWAMSKILERLSKNVYITFDIDALDPAYAPATGTPEPGGMTWRQATRIIEEVSQAKHVVGADIVEVAPFQNGNCVTEFLAVRLAGKIMACNCTVDDYIDRNR